MCTRVLENNVLFYPEIEGSISVRDVFDYRDWVNLCTGNTLMHTFDLSSEVARWTPSSNSVREVLCVLAYITCPRITCLVVLTLTRAQCASVKMCTRAHVLCLYWFLARHIARPIHVHTCTCYMHHVYTYVHFTRAHVSCNKTCCTRNNTCFTRENAACNNTSSTHAHVACNTKCCVQILIYT